MFSFRAIDDILRDQTKGEGVLELLDLKTEAPTFDSTSTKAAKKEKETAAEDG